MASTLSFIPLVGLDKIHAIRNAANDDVLLSRAVPAAPTIPQDALGRPGTMRIGFRLYQSDGTTADDLSLGIFLKCPIPFELPADQDNYPKWSPVSSVAYTGTLDTNPRLVQANPALASYGTPGVADAPQILLAQLTLTSQVGAYWYDVFFDWSHTVAS